MIRASTDLPDFARPRQYDAACRIVAKCPLRCTATTASNSSSLVLAIILSRTMPALFTQTSSPPNVSTAVWISSAACFQSATLDPLATASPPSAVISSTTLCAALPPLAGEPSRPTPMSLTTTRAPSAAKASACARPIPPPAPVTMTTRPSAIPIPVSPLLDRARRGQIVRRLAAPVHLQRRAADVGRRIGRQKPCGPTDILRFGQPAERHVLRNSGDRLGVTVEQIGLFGFDHADHEGVHPDLRRPFHRQRLGEALHPRLRRSVRGGAGRRPSTADAGDVDDRPAVLLGLHLVVGML